jgi:hypothetical protein
MESPARHRWRGAGTLETDENGVKNNGVKDQKATRVIADSERLVTSKMPIPCRASTAF